MCSGQVVPESRVQFQKRCWQTRVNPGEGDRGEATCSLTFLALRKCFQLDSELLLKAWNVDHQKGFQQSTLTVYNIKKQLCYPQGPAPCRWALHAAQGQVLLGRKAALVAARDPPQSALCSPPGLLSQQGQVGGRHTTLQGQGSREGPGDLGCAWSQRLWAPDPASCCSVY